ncbi:hypothetical protein [Streptomyces xantholiticus]|uniref:Uncharacterized protein n=1 Tax=Streptomyces xantholiticus TaxID=68285 RepID=A0ABV1V3I1_9ACTN
MRSERSLPAVIAATAAAQSALHLWFVQAGGHGAHQPHTIADHSAHEAWHAGHHGTSMAAAHIAAALLVAWGLQRADAASRCLGQRLGETLAGWFVRLAPTGSLPAVPQVVARLRLVDISGDRLGGVPGEGFTQQLGQHFGRCRSLRGDPRIF